MTTPNNRSAELVALAVKHADFVRVDSVTHETRHLLFTIDQIEAFAAALAVGTPSDEAACSRCAGTGLEAYEFKEILPESALKEVVRRVSDEMPSWGPDSGMHGFGMAVARAVLNLKAAPVANDADELANVSLDPQPPGYVQCPECLAGFPLADAIRHAENDLTAMQNAQAAFTCNRTKGGPCTYPECKCDGPAADGGCAAPEAAPVQPQTVADEMVSRFLGWRLPEDFSPDCGISFKPLGHPNGWPVGTNLLTAIQARKMLEHVLAAPAAQATQGAAVPEEGMKASDWFTDPTKVALGNWAAERWHAEVANRPMVNVHRRALDDTWRQVLRHLGVDDRARLGPTHDELRAEIGSKEWAAMNGGDGWPAGSGTMAAQATPAPVLAEGGPCTTCGVLYAKHGSYPTCATHPYAAHPSKPSGEEKQ